MLCGPVTWCQGRRPCLSTSGAASSTPGTWDRFIAVIPTAGEDWIMRQGNDVPVGLSTAALKGLMEDCGEAMCQVIVLDAPGGRLRVTVVGKRDGHHAACIRWSALPKEPSKY